MKRIDPFTYYYPTLDLHGEISRMVEVLVNSFINDNIIMKHDHLVIIHGKGKFILKKKLAEVLKSNQNVSKFYLDMNNPGATIVELKIDK